MKRTAKVAIVVLVLVSLAFLLPAWACGPPRGNFPSPLNGSTVSGTTTIKMKVTSETTVVGVDLYVDEYYIATDTKAPYSIEWDTTSAHKHTSGDTHKVSAKIRSKNRKQGEIKAITVTVKN